MSGVSRFAGTDQRGKTQKNTESSSKHPEVYNSLHRERMGMDGTSGCPRVLAPSSLLPSTWCASMRRLGGVNRSVSSLLLLHELSLASTP